MTKSSNDVLSELHCKVLLAMIRKDDPVEFKKIVEDLLENFRHIVVNEDRDVATWWFPNDDHYQTEVKNAEGAFVWPVVKSKERDGARKAHFKALRKVLEEGGL